LLLPLLLHLRPSPFNNPLTGLASYTISLPLRLLLPPLSWLLLPLLSWLPLLFPTLFEAWADWQYTEDEWWWYKHGRWAYTDTSDATSSIHALLADKFAAYDELIAQLHEAVVVLSDENSTLRENLPLDVAQITVNECTLQLRNAHGNSTSNQILHDRIAVLENTIANQDSKIRAHLERDLQCLFDDVIRRIGVSHGRTSSKLCQYQS